MLRTLLQVMNVEGDTYDVRLFGGKHDKHLVEKAYIRPISININSLQVRERDGGLVCSVPLYLSLDLDFQSERKGLFQRNRHHYSRHIQVEGKCVLKCYAKRLNDKL